MTEEQRLEVLEKIATLKAIFHLHQTHKIIKDEAEREKHLFTIVDAIRELEEELSNDLDHLN